MKLITRNVALRPALRLSPWRKIAMGTWRTAGDPSVHAFCDVPAEPVLAWIEKLREETGLHITLTHVVGKIFGELLHHHPEINCLMRWGRLYPRKSVDIFFQVATDAKGDDLSGATIREVHRKSVADIAREMASRVQSIKTRKDTTYKKVKGIMGKLPGILVAPMLNLTSFILYTLNIWSPLLGAPKDSFGSIMITNIGSLGLDAAFAPLVPYSRVPLLVAITKVSDQPVVRDGEVVVGKMLKLCFTFDHRLIDGVHASHMYHRMVKLFQDPSQLS